MTAAEEPKPKTLVLFDSEEDVNKAQIEPVSANTSVTSAGTLRVQTEPNKEFPGVIFKPKAGTVESVGLCGSIGAIEQCRDRAGQVIFAS